MSTAEPDGGKYVVIGAGASGLAAAKNLRQQGIRCEILEAADGVGGIWDRANPRSSVYATTHTITSREVTAYPDLAMPDSYPVYPRHEQILDYLRAYAAQHELVPLIRFGAEVQHLWPEGAGWRLRTTDGAVRRYRGAVIANGHNWAPNLPHYPGNFTGQILHARDYDRPHQFDGKRVLVVGAGNSGCDIVVDAARHADEALLSMRRGYYFVPKFALGRPVDQIGQSTQSTRLPLGFVRLGYRALLRLSFGRPQDYGLPAPDHRLLESPPIVNSLVPYYAAHGRVQVRPDIARFCGDKVEFTDGSLAAVDVVVYATGYRITVPFMDDQHLDWRNGRPGFYLLAFSPTYRNLFIAGMTDGTGGHFPTVDLQTQLIARFVAGMDARTPQASALAQRTRGVGPDVSGGVRFIDSPRSLTQFELNTYVRALRREIKALS